MRRAQTISIVVAAALTAAFVAGAYWWGMQHGMQMTSSPAAVGDSVSTGAATADAGRKVLYWHDPMVPGPRFDKPGKSPFMNMMLEPVYADAGADEGKVTISPRVQQNLGIRTTPVTRGAMAPTLEVTGTVAFNERDVVMVQARANGFVEKLWVRAPLDPVRARQPLAELYVPDWVAAQEEYLAVLRMQSGGLDAVIDGARQRMRLAGMSETQIAQVTERGTQVHRLTIDAPRGGIVTELGAREGMAVTMGATLFRINGLSTVWINAEVPEAAAAQVRPGQPVEVRAPALPGTVLRGRVGTILPDVNPVTRTVKVRVEVDNPGARLLPGYFATVSVAPAGRNEALMVPSEAVIRTGTRTVVFVQQDDGKFVAAPVETGMDAGGMTEIRAGLAPGQKVVTSGQFLVDSEASLKATTTRMGDAPELGAPGGSAGVAVPSDPATHRGEGRVEAIAPDEVTLSHGPIPSLKWGDMTMGFRLPAPGAVAGVKVGDAVTFAFRARPGGVYEITSIAPMTKGPSAEERTRAIGEPARSERKGTP